MRRSFPRRSFVLPDVRRASNAGLRFARSSIGVYPADWNGFVSSPVERNRLPSPSKSILPPTWQHSPRDMLTRRISCSLAKSSPLLWNLKRDSRLYPLNWASRARSASVVRVSGASPSLMPVPMTSVGVFSLGE